MRDTVCLIAKKKYIERYIVFIECVNKSKAEEPKIQRKKRNIPTRANFKWELPIKYMVDESAGK